MVTRGHVRAGFCLVVLLAAWSVAGGILASQMGQRKLHPAHRLLPVYATPPPYAAHASHPIADDSLTHFSAELQTLEVLPFSAFLLTFTLYTMPGAEKDLLSLTQRRRE